MTPEEVWLITGASRGIGAELVKQVWLRAAQHVLHPELAFTQMLLAQVLAKDNTSDCGGQVTQDFSTPAQPSGSISRPLAHPHS